MEKLPSCPPTRLGTQGICTTTEKVGRKRLPSSPAHRSPLSPRALSYEETASSTASLTAADCARMDNFISTVLLDLPFSRHQVTRARTRMYTDTHTHTHTHVHTVHPRPICSLPYVLLASPQIPPAHSDHTFLPALSFKVWSSEHT